MRIAYINENWLKNEVRKIMSKHLPSNKYKVFFFGSRIKGNSFERSDIDVGIQGPEPIPIEAKLKIEEDLENLPTLYTFDLVDFQKSSETFRKHAMKNIEYLI